MNSNPYSDISDAQHELELSRALRAAGERLGFPLFMFLMRCLRSCAPPQQFVFSNTPERFFEASFNPEDSRRDPVLNRLKKTTLPLIYDQQLYAHDGAGDLWEAQAPFGYRTGIAVAVQLDGGRRTLLGFDRDEAIPQNSQVRAKLLGELMLIANLATEAADRVLAPQLASAEQQNLTGQSLTLRERLCLHWVGRGFPDHEIAKQMQMTRRTVERDVQTATEKLAAANRAQAAVEALKLGLVDDELLLRAASARGRKAYAARNSATPA